MEQFARPCQICTESGLFQVSTQWCKLVSNTYHTLHFLLSTVHLIETCHLNILLFYYFYQNYYRFLYLLDGSVLELPHQYQNYRYNIKRWANIISPKYIYIYIYISFFITIRYQNIFCSYLQLSLFPISFNFSISNSARSLYKMHFIRSLWKNLYDFTE